MINSAPFSDNGDNSCENMFSIVSTTSIGTAAGLTVATIGSAPNPNSTIGDPLLVEGVNLAGYNGYFPAGITAVSATTITYTTVGSNIGASGSSSAHCRNLQSYSGNPPKALLTNRIPNLLCNRGSFCDYHSPIACMQFQSAERDKHHFHKSILDNGNDSRDGFNHHGYGRHGERDADHDLRQGNLGQFGRCEHVLRNDYFQAQRNNQRHKYSGTCATPPIGVAISYNISQILSNW
jgi:hypothetical protein